MHTSQQDITWRVDGRITCTALRLTYHSDTTLTAQYFIGFRDPATTEEEARAALAVTLQTHHLAVMSCWGARGVGTASFNFVEPGRVVCRLDQGGVKSVGCGATPAHALSAAL